MLRPSSPVSLRRRSWRFVGQRLLFVCSNERLLCLYLQFLATLQRQELQDTRLKIGTAWKRASTVPKVNHAVHEDAVKCGDEVEWYHVGKCEKSVHVNAEFFKVC